MRDVGGYWDRDRDVGDQKRDMGVTGTRTGTWGDQDRDMGVTGTRIGTCGDQDRDMGVLEPHRDMGAPHSGHGYGSPGTRRGTWDGAGP